MKRLRIFAATFLTVAVAGITVSTAVADTATRSMDVAVDGQVYVTDAQTTNPNDGSIVDMYGGDQSVIHVAMHGGTEQARSFMHIALDYLPEKADPRDAKVVTGVAVKTDASKNGIYDLYNVNVEQAIVQACVLKTPFPAQFDRDNPPEPDCAHGSVIGKPNDDLSKWTFELAPLVTFWKTHGNTGLALLPIAESPGASWSVSFAKPKSSAHVVFTLPSGAAKPAPTTSPAAGAATGTGPGSTGGGSTSSSTGGSGGSSYVPPVSSAGNPAPVTSTAPAPAQQPAVAAPAQPTTTATTPVASKSDDGSDSWPWVLALSILVAAGAIGVAHRAAVAQFLARVVPPGVAAFRTHPRAYSVACAALAWGLVFTSYSVVTGSGGSGGTELAGAQPTVTTPGAVAPSPTPSGSLSTALNSSGATSVPGTTAGTGATAGGSTSGGASVSSPGSPQSAAADEFKGRGEWRTINGIPVFFPADGGVPVAKLYTGADDVIGLTPDALRICAHAALTYGPAFDIDKSDLDVYWSHVNDELHGIYGRQVQTNYFNDDYDPGKAVTAAQQCRDWGTFLLLGGIGFDQIPAVRQWAEQNHQLYLHHVATIQGTAGQRYSFSALPTVEQTGEAMGHLAVDKFRGKKIGIIYRASTNWTPGYELFKKVVKAAGMTVVGEYGTNVNQGNYTQELTQLRSAGAEVVFAWENALAATEMIKQAQGQDWHPSWLLFPFNLTTYTLDQDHTATDQDIWGLAMYDAYDPGYYGGGFSSYADEIKEFERQYKKYDPSANLAGGGGDLLFLNWEAMKWLHKLLLVCGPDCTRNKIAGLLLAGFDKPVPPNCPIDFGRTSDHHHGGYLFNVMHVQRDPSGRANFMPTQRCVAAP